MSLISVGQLDDEGCSTSFGKSGWKISKGALVMARGLKKGTLYKLREKKREKNVVFVAKEGTSSYLWYKCLGHMRGKDLRVFVGKNFLPGLNSYELDLCENCIYGRK